MSGATIGRMFHSAEAVETFLGFPACADLSRLEAEVAILGVPAATPYRSVGAYCAGAPAALRAAMAGYAANRGHQDFDLLAAPFADAPSGGARVADCGDLPFDENDFAANRAAITGAVRQIRAAGATPVVLGGDDSVPIPLFQAFDEGGPYTVLQIDAHIDWRDEVDGERYGLSSPMRRASEMPWIERIVQVGARAIGSARAADYEDARAWGVEFVTGREVARHGIEPVLERIPRGAKVLFTLDCDGMDPTVMPAVIGPAPGGLGYWQVVELVHGVAERGSLAGFDLVEFMPAADRDGLGALTAARVVCNVLGALLAR